MREGGRKMEEERRKSKGKEEHQGEKEGGRKRGKKGKKNEGREERREKE